MSLAKKFLEASACLTIMIGSLDTEKPNTMTHVQRIDTRFGPTVLISIRDSEFALKMFLPRRYSEVVTDEDITRFNSNKAKLYLIYRGVCRRRMAFYWQSPEMTYQPNRANLCECSVPAAIMDFLLFNDVSLLPNSGIGMLCEDLNSILGQGLWYDEYKVRNTKWLQLVSDIVEAMYSDTVLGGCFRLYPSYVADILTSVKSIDFYVVCSEKLNYAHYIQQRVEGINYTINDTGNNFLISYHSEIIYISFETRIVHIEFPSTLSFAYNVLTKMRISSLAYGIVSFNKRVTFITSEVPTSRHDCVSNLFAYNLHAPMQVAVCKVYNRYCNRRPTKRFPS
jgi:hypothetical protein